MPLLPVTGVGPMDLGTVTDTDCIEGRAIAPAAQGTPWQMCYPRRQDGECTCAVVGGGVAHWYAVAVRSHV